jgi:3-oxoacyl-[acyl-carrier protein] reductase
MSHQSPVTSHQKELKGRVGIVTGASRGIGRAIALRLAQEGARLAFIYAQNDDMARSLLKELKAAGNEGLSFKGDVRDYQMCREFVEKVKEFFGGLDFLVNNAGITRDKAFMTMEPDEWRQVIETNLTGTFNMARSAIVTFLKQKSGNIVNISSISGISGTSRQTNYAASKAGIIGLTKALAREVAAYGIRVNCVAPGYIDTDMTAALKEELKAKFTEAIPLGRFGRPEEIAGTVAFLLSDRSRYLTGQVIKADGGLHTSW